MKETKMQRCGTCGAEKPATTEHFHKNKGGRNGLSSICRPCRNEYMRQHRQDQKDQNQNQKSEEN